MKEPFNTFYHDGSNLRIHRLGMAFDKILVMYVDWQNPECDSMPFTKRMELYWFWVSRLNGLHLPLYSSDLTIEHAKIVKQAMPDWRVYWLENQTEV